MKHPVSRTIAKSPAHVSVRPDLLDAARALIEEPKRQQAEKWRSENRAAIHNYNEYVVKRGVFADDSRGF